MQLEPKVWGEQGEAENSPVHSVQVWKARGRQSRLRLLLWWARIHAPTHVDQWVLLGTSGSW